MPLLLPGVLLGLQMQLPFVALLGVHESSLCVLLKILIQLLFVSSLAVPESPLCVLMKMLMPLLVPGLPLVLRMQLLSSWALLRVDEGDDAGAVHGVAGGWQYPAMPVDVDEGDDADAVCGVAGCVREPTLRAVEDDDAIANAVAVPLSATGFADGGQDPALCVDDGDDDGAVCGIAGGG